METKVVDYQPIFVKDCHNPKWVKVGKWRVFCTSWRDFEEGQLDSLDVIVGLSESWLERTVYVPERFREIVDVEDKIIVCPVKDGGVSERAIRVVANLIEAGLKVGIGCISGHGRTGWLVGRLIMRYEGKLGKEVVEEVRKRLCEKAIESREQYFDLGLSKEELVKVKVGESYGHGKHWYAEKWYDY